MKSIREWMKGNSDDFGASVSGVAAHDPSPVDQDIEAELRPKIRRIMDMDRFRSMPAGDLLNGVSSVVSSAMAAAGGTSRRPPQSSEVDPQLRDELGPKVERIMDMEAYRSEPREELERKIISAVYKLVANMSGPNQTKINDDPVAKEWSALPSFVKWAEENETGRVDALSEPQHEKGESNMELKAVVEKRLMQMAVELEADGKGSRQEVLAAVKAVADAASGKPSQGQAPEAAQQGNAQPGQQAAQPQANA